LTLKDRALPLTTPAIQTKIKVQSLSTFSTFVQICSLFTGVATMMGFRPKLSEPEPDHVTAEAPPKRCG
jgi:hypothetical protein